MHSRGGMTHPVTGEWNPTEVRSEPPVSLEVFAGEDPSAMRVALFQCLQDACGNRHSPLRTLSLASVAEDGWPQVRTVVFRGFDAQRRQVRMHTDVRSPKVAAFRRDPRATLLWYAPVWKLQVRAKAVVAVHHQNEVAAAYWGGSDPRSRRTYSAPQAPGTPTVHGVTDLAPHLVNAIATDENTAAGLAHFTVLLAELQTLEWLMLSAEGNRRGCFHAEGSGWRHEWLAP